MRILLLMLAFEMGGMAQTVESRSVMLKGTSLPASCVVGERFFKTDATAGENLYLCTSTNTWTQVSGTGGTTEPSGLACGVTRTSATVLTVFSGASSSAPCIVGGTRFTSSATLTTSGTAATGTYRFEVRAGVIYARLPGATTGLTESGLTREASSASFSATGVPLWTWDQAVAGTWDTGTGTDYRSWLTTQIVPACGTGLNCSDSGGVRTSAVDNTYAMTLPDAQTSTAKKTFSPTASAAGIALTCAALPSSPANGDIACDSGDSNKVKVRSNGAWVEAGGGSSTTLSGNYWYWSLFRNYPSSYNVLGTTPRVWHDVAPFSAPVTKVAFAINGSAPLPGANADGIVVGIYEAGCATQIVTGPAYTSTSTSGLVTLASTWNMVKDTVYCFMLGTDSTTVQIASPDQSGSLIAAMINSGTTRAGTCANPIEGGGTTLELPNTADGGCGTITSSIVPFHLTFLP